MNCESGWADREAAARHRLVRKEIATKAICWLIIAPVIPLFILHEVTAWIASVTEEAPNWCNWLAKKADAYAERRGVRI